MNTMNLLRSPVALTFCCALAAQANGDAVEASAPDVEQEKSKLASRVDRAHRGERVGESIDSFKNAEIHLIQQQPKQDRMEIVITADFDAPRSLRYRTAEGAEKWECGFDEDGAWAVVNGKPLPLNQKEHEKTEETIKKYLRVTNQLVRFLDPGAVIRSIETTRAPSREVLKLGRGRSAAAIRLNGDIDKFPLYTGGGQLVKARVSLWFDAKSHRLLALRAFQFRGAAPSTSGEFVIMDDYRELGGVQLPTKLSVYRDDGGRPIGEVTVEIHAIELGAEFEGGHFDRPSK